MIIIKKRFHLKVITLTLFASSSENQAKKVRILYYGQSIVAERDADALIDQFCHL